MMQSQHGGHAQQEALSSHCVPAMSQGGQGAGVASQSVPDPHQVGRKQTPPVCSSVQASDVFVLPNRSARARCPLRAASRA